jgi:hypothetical protein
VTSKSTNWKDHPLAIAAISMVATTGFCILVLSEVILPTYKERLKNQIAEIPPLQKKISESEKRIQELEHEIKNLKLELMSARNLNLFSNGNPYPSGLEIVKIGDTISKVSDVFSASQINREKDGYWSVTIQNSAIESATYYFDTTSETKNIMMISINYKDFVNKDSRDALKRLLIESLGMPKHEKDDGFSWVLEGGIKVYLSGLIASYRISKDIDLSDKKIQIERSTVKN